MQLSFPFISYFLLCKLYKKISLINWKKKFSIKIILYKLIYKSL